MKKNVFRKAADGGNLIVVLTAIGVLILLGMYFLSQSVMTGYSSTNTKFNNALIQGAEELKK